MINASTKLLGKLSHGVFAEITPKYVALHANIQSIDRVALWSYLQKK